MRELPKGNVDPLFSGRLSFDRFLPLLLCAAGALGVLPFAIIRFINGEWLVGLLDATIVAAFATLAAIVLRSRSVRFASVAITLLCLGGFMATLYMMGPQQIYWGYPSLIVAFYLLRPNEGIVAALATLTVIVPILVMQLELFAFVTVLSTMIITSVFAYVFAALTLNQRELLSDQATCDPLTGAGNRRALRLKIENVIAQHERTASPCSLIMLDLDAFKGINDEFGHAVGDDVLVRLSEVIKLRIRVTDSFFRIGGEEFVILVDGQTIESAGRLADQLRLLVEANELGPRRDVTISLGVAELQPAEDADTWLKRADEALYRAKRSGRNATRLADAPAGGKIARVAASAG